MNPSLAAVLRGHGAALVLTDQKWMPRPSEIVDRFDPVTGLFSVVRLLGDREGIEQVTRTWGATVLDRLDDLRDDADALARLAGRVPVYAFAANHYAGYAPDTVAHLRSLLGFPEPVPPERTPHHPFLV